MEIKTDFSAYLDKINSILLKSLPDTPDQFFIEKAFGRSGLNINGINLTSSREVQELLKPNRELLLSGGKRWRPLFLVLCAEGFIEKNRICGQQAEKLLSDAYTLTPLLEFVHTASLIHDDIEDHSQERRGKPAAYLTYGLDTALNSASWLYFEAPVCIKSIIQGEEVKQALYDAYLVELRKLHLGQAMDIYWHRQESFIPKQEEYLFMVKSKTGTLSSLAARIGSLIAGAKPEEVEEMALCASKIGAGFQIIDDVINLTTGNAGKDRGDDIVEGKKSLPVILFFEQASKEEQEELTGYFKEAHNSSTENPAVEKAINLMKKNNSIEKAREIGLKLIEESLEEFEQLLGSKNIALTKIKFLFQKMSPGKAGPHV